MQTKLLHQLRGCSLCVRTDNGTLLFAEKSEHRQLHFPTIKERITCMYRATTTAVHVVTSAFVCKHIFHRTYYIVLAQEFQVCNIIFYQKIERIASGNALKTIYRWYSNSRS